MTEGPGDTAGWRFRRPVEADHRYLVDRVDDWWGGRRIRAMLPRLWFQHFSGTSWVVERPDGRIIGFLVAFVSQDHPDVGYVRLVGTDPNHRRDGLGRALYERAFADLRGHGVREVRAITWPGNRISIAFHRALGFRVDDGPGTMRLYGTPAYPDYDGDGEDRVALSRSI
jgi:GNAT superfamily N-acetyltransferase